MSTQAVVRSIDALRELRTAMALYGEDTLSALGSVDMEVRRVVQWLQYDRPAYWQEQVKRRREEVAAARAEVFRRKLAKTPDYTPAFSEQKELLRRAEARLQDAETRAALSKSWAVKLPQAVLEYHACSRRLGDHARSDVPRAVASLTRMIEAIEAYLSEPPPTTSGHSAPAPTSVVDTAAARAMDEEPTPSPGPPVDEVDPRTELP